MRKKWLPVILAVSVMLILSMTFAGNVAAKKLIIFAGGPAGGTAGAEDDVEIGSNTTIATQDAA